MLDKLLKIHLIFFQSDRKNRKVQVCFLLKHCKFNILMNIAIQILFGIFNSIKGCTHMFSITVLQIIAFILFITLDLFVWWMIYHYVQDAICLGSNNFVLHFRKPQICSQIICKSCFSNIHNKDKIWKSMCVNHDAGLNNYIFDFLWNALLSRQLRFCFCLRFWPWSITKL